MSEWEIRELYQIEKIELKSLNIDDLRVYKCPKCWATTKHPLSAKRNLKYCPYCGEKLQVPK